MKRFLVTAGPTREYIDTVRFLSNASTGRTGYEIAREALRQENEVILVSGPTALDPPSGSCFIPVVSAQDMAAAVLDRLEGIDVVIGTAAVCDWQPAERASHKLSKRSDSPDIRWVKTPDILAIVGERKGTRLTIGFALEDAIPLRRAAEKLEAKNLDYIVLNGPEAMGSEGGFYDLLARRGARWSLGYLAKERLAALLVGLALEGESALPQAE